MRDGLLVLRLSRKSTQDHHGYDQQRDGSSVDRLIWTHKEAHGGIEENQAAE